MDETVLGRLRLVMISLGLLAGLVVFQLMRIELEGEGKAYLRDLSQTISQRPVEFAPARGRIFDRDNELLAANDVQYEVGLSTPYVVNPEDVATTLAGLLGRPIQDMRLAAASDRPYVLIDRPVTSEIGNQIKDLRETNDNLNLSGLDLTPIAHRTYPGGSLAAQVLGFVAYNADGRQLGYFGVEGFYNDILAGRSVKGVERLVPFDTQPDPTPDQGADLYLTIDRDIQYLVEGSLQAALDRYDADGGSIVVLDPRNGEILAMASAPGFDPNNYVQAPPPDPANPAVSGQYEPGSTFKILTMAAALDSGAAQADKVYVDNGTVEIGGVFISNWNRGAFGPVDMTGCLRHSINTCLATLATWMGPTTFYNYLSAFGLGQLTNVDLAAEAPGRLKRPGDPDWFDSDLGTNAFGQGVAVTPLQLAAAVSAVANRGAMMQPHILQRVSDGGASYTTQPQVLGRPIRPETAQLLNEMLANSLVEEGSAALAPGYRIAGKTGTAQIPIAGGYDAYRTIASFVGWGPVDDPRFLVLVKLDRPSASIWGSETAAPVFGELARRLVVLMELPPDDVRLALQNP